MAGCCANWIISHGKVEPSPAGRQRRVNYAVTKDDVGNWYVKSYGANASNIYQSAINLGAYASGGAFAPALLQSAKTMASSPAATATGPTNTTPSAPVAPFQKQFDSVMLEYTNGVWAAFTSLTQDLSMVSNKISSEWARNPAVQAASAISNALFMRLTNLNFGMDIQAASKQAKTNDPVATDTQARLLLKKLLDAEKQTFDNIAASGSDTNVVKTAQASAEKIVRTFITEQADKRREILDKCTTSLGVVQKGLSP